MPLQSSIKQRIHCCVKQTRRSRNSWPVTRRRSLTSADRSRRSARFGRRLLSQWSSTPGWAAFPIIIRSARIGGSEQNTEHVQDL